MLGAVKKHYDQRALKYHESFKRCGWRSPESQLRRFWAMTRLFSLERALILDAGCGDGEFFSFCKEHFPQWRYVGVDVSTEMINIARNRFPDGLFIEGNVFEITGDYDYVVGSGIFSHFLHSNDLGIALSHLFSLSEVATSTCILSNRFNEQSPSSDLRTYPMAEVLNAAQYNTHFYDINATYATNDVCLTLLKR